MKDPQLHTLPANNRQTQGAIIQPPAILKNNLPSIPTNRKQSSNAIPIPQLALLQMQPFKGLTAPQMLLQPRVPINHLTRLNPQSLQIFAKRKPREPPIIHSMINNHQLLQHHTALPNRLHPIETPLTPNKLQLHQPPTPLRQNRQPNVRNHGIIEPLQTPNQFQNLQIPARRHAAQDGIVAPLQLELLQRGALGTDGRNPGLAGAGDLELPQIGAAAGERSETRVNGLTGQQIFHAPRAIHAQRNQLVTNYNVG